MAAAHSMFDLVPSFSEAKQATKLFYGLPEEILSSLARSSAMLTFQKGEIVFGEQDTINGVFIVEQGRVKLSLNSEDGKALIIRIAGPGDTLGISSIFLGKPQQVTAQALENTQVSFVRRADFLALFNGDGKFRLHLTQEISLEYSDLCQAVSRVGVPKAAMVRLAELLLAWAGSEEIKNQVQVECLYSHEEIGQMIDASRETITRLLHTLRENGMVTLTKRKLRISNLGALRALAVSE